VEFEVFTPLFINIRVL